MQLEWSAKANHSSGFASSLSSGLHSTERDVYREPGFVSWIERFHVIYQVKVVSSEKTMRCHSYLHHLPWTTHSNKKGWLINQILWTLPSSWRSCWNLALTSRPTIMDIFNITDDDSTLEGEQAVFDKHDEDVSLPSVLIKASHCYASRSVLHPLSRKEQCMWASAKPGATLRLHSWAIRFSNSLNLERMMISVWGRSRNVSLIDYWKSSACLQPHGHVGMTDGKEMFDGNILCSFV